MESAMCHVVIMLNMLTHVRLEMPGVHSAFNKAWLSKCFVLWMSLKSQSYLVITTQLGETSEANEYVSVR